jgi:SAM-dependent methyltransferase
MEQNFSEDYQDYIKWHWWFQGRKKILEKYIQKNLIGEKNPKILSIGSTQFDYSLLSPFGNVHFSSKQDETYNTSEHIAKKLIFSELPDLPFASNTFDFVSALDVIEHIEEDEESLQELGRVVKSGGRVLITVPAYEWPWSPHDDQNNHKRRYTLTQMRQKLKSSGLSVIDQSYFNTFLFAPIALVKVLEQFFPSLFFSGSSSFEKNQPGFINTVLSWIFGLESALLPTYEFPFGISLVVVFN